MRYFILVLVVVFSNFASAQHNRVNYDEAKVPDYTLPELLKSPDGTQIENVRQWEKIRKPELIHLFEQEVYGEIPGTLSVPNIVLREKNGEALNGLAIRRQVDLVFAKDGKELTIGILLYLPKTEEKVPVFLGYNFMGNATINPDPNILPTTSWIPAHSFLAVADNQNKGYFRGMNGSRWPVELIIKSGFCLATAYYGDVDPDRNDFFDGIHPFLYSQGQTRPESDEWGAISAWAWGLSRIMDYLETDENVNSDKVVVIGHSRLGKTVLWAAATDPRFAACISNDSGCGGAAISRRKFGETVSLINSAFPHWFCGNFKKYNDLEDELPVDQHMLIALIAPRPVYVASATKDLWADPKGEFFSAKLASEIYNLYGLQGLPADEMPLPDTPVSGTIGYHIRSGKHEITEFDWRQYITFTQKHLHVIP